MTEKRMNTQRVLQFIALISFVCTAILGQAELIGEPTRHYVTIIAFLASTILAFYMQPKRDIYSQDRASDPPKVIEAIVKDLPPVSQSKLQELNK